jgi:hypothetical protein
MGLVLAGERLRGGSEEEEEEDQKLHSSYYVTTVMGIKFLFPQGF